MDEDRITAHHVRISVPPLVLEILSTGEGGVWVQIDDPRLPGSPTLPTRSIPPDEWQTIQDALTRFEYHIDYGGGQHVITLHYPTVLQELGQRLGLLSEHVARLQAAGWALVEETRQYHYSEYNTTADYQLPEAARRMIVLLSSEMDEIERAALLRGC